MTTRRTNKGGFTLVEILIVVIILGILAAIVIPQFTNASQDARKSSVSSQLQSVRSQIELWKLQHQDKLPNLTGTTSTTGWNLLTKQSDYLGAIPPGTGLQAFGPYLQQVPINALNSMSNVIAGNGGTVSGINGWIYDYGTGGNGTGKFWAGGATTGTYFNEATGADVTTAP
jgi:general secretion pathway protein G